MPPPRMMMSRPSFEAGAMFSVWVLKTDTTMEEVCELAVQDNSRAKEKDRVEKETV